MKIKHKIFIAFLSAIILTVIIFLVLKILNINISDNNNIYTPVISFAIFSAAGFTASFIISKNINSGFAKLNTFFKNFFTDEKLSDKINNEAKNRKDDFKKTFEDLNNLYNSYKSYINFAEEIKNGNYKAKYKFSEKEKLAEILNEIKENLKKADKEQKHNITELEQNRWYRAGVTDFALLLQQDFKNTEEMAYPVIKKLAEHLSVEQAGIFILKNINEKQILVLEAAYAYDKKKQLDTEVEIGESLVGKCAKEQKLIKIDDLPEGYTYISSGMGEDTPKTLILAPLIYEKKLFGVVEIASLKTIPDYKINFLNVITERIAAEIYNINTKKLTAKLAEDYKIQSEELALRDKRSNDTINKLESEKQQLLQMNNSFLNRIELFNKFLPVISVNAEKTVIKINDAAAKLYDVDKNNVLNKQFSENFTDTNLDEIFEKLSENKETVIKRKQKNGSDIIERFIPITDKNNNINEIMITAIKLS